MAYVSPDERYPPGWFFDGKSEVKHDPVPLRETWQALEELVDRGYIKHLGVSNMSSSLLMDLLSYARIKPSVLQIGASHAAPCLLVAQLRSRIHPAFLCSARDA